MTVGMGLSSTPGRALTAEDAEFDKYFLLDSIESDDAAFASRASFCSAIPFATFSEAFFLPVFFSASPALSAVKAFRFLSARAIASASHAAFTLPRVAGGLVVHSAEPASPA